MSALLIYKNETPEILAWSEDFKARSSQAVEGRAAWMAALYDAHGVPDDDAIRGAFVRGEEFSGISWPEDAALPSGWFRPVKTPELIRPRSNGKVARAALTAMRQFNYPDVRHELRQRFGMPSVAFVGLHMYRPGMRITDDAVWITWGTRDAVDSLGDKLDENGWVRVPLVEYIGRFGEDDL